MCELPTPGAVCTLLRELLGREVSASAPAVKVAEFDPAAVGLYLGPSGAVVAWWALEAGAAASAAAALSMVPPAISLEASKQGLTALLLENLHEVLNVGSQLFGAKNQHVSLKSVLSGPAAKTALAQLQPGAAKAELELKIGGYTGGRVRLGVVAK